MLNSSGELVGINTQIYSLSGGSSGIGFAIPIDKVIKVLPLLKKYGKVVRPYLGVSLLNDSIARANGINGAIIRQVFHDSPADKAGLEGLKQDRRGNLLLGDVIQGINGKEITNTDDLFLELEKFIASEQS